MVIKFTKIISIAIIWVIVYLSCTSHNTYAYEYMVTSSASFKKDGSEYSFDPRIVILKNFLTSHNSPLSDHAVDFVSIADTYGLDWRFVPAITGVESTFGKRIPYNSYNAYGWNSGDYYFDSWEHSIEHVSKFLKENYIDDGLTSIDQIARRYAASPDWAWKVKYFQEKIDPLPLEFTL
ncbi:glucosaminidase domain-containing protein [Candidatus Woesebacteria bacterium]|nr:glucosaminidase domain-containing protein [Candidatus Woesebacteria bacterium]